MSKAVLISIRPEWCEKIAAGQKTIEVRKTRPKLEAPFKCYIYCTAAKKTDNNLWITDLTGYNHLGNRKVVGEFLCDRIDAYESEFWDDDSVFNAVWKIEPDEDDEDISYSYEVMSNEDDSKRAFEKAICMTIKDLKTYIGADKPNKTFYGWHISNLVIYDNPIEVKGLRKKYDINAYLCHTMLLSRPPQSWCYVEVIK